MLIEQIFRLGAELFVGIWVARHLGAAQFGVFSYAVAFVAIFGVVAKLGLDNIVVRSLVNDSRQKDLYLGTAFWLKIGGALLALVGVVIALQFTSGDDTTRAYVVIIALGMIFQSVEVVAFYFQSQVKAKYTSFSKLIQLSLSSLLKIYLVNVDADLKWFVYVSLLDQVSLSVSYLTTYGRQMGLGFLGRFDVSIARQLLKSSWPLIFSSLAVMIYMRIDQVMIKEMLGDKEVGIYSVSVRLSEVWYFIPMVVIHSLFPSLLNAKNVSAELYAVRLQRLYTSMTWVAIIVAITTTILSDQLVMLLYGNSYVGAGELLRVNIWAGVLVSLSSVTSAWLISEGLQHFDLYRAISGATINIVLNLILIPTQGMLGAAIATLISYAVPCFLFDLLHKRTRLIFFMKIRAFLFLGLKS